MNKNFVVYEEDTGRILKSGFCPESLLSAQAKTGQAVKVTEDRVNDALFQVSLETLEIVPIENP